VRAALAVALGAARPAPAPSFDAKAGYQLEKYREALWRAALKATLAARAQLPTPIRSLKLGHMNEQITLAFVIVQGRSEEYAEIELAAPRTRLPDSISASGEDPLLRRFYRSFGEDPDAPSDNLPAWGDVYALPWCLVIHEQLGAVERLAAELRKAGVELARDCKLGVGEGDSFWSARDGFTRMTRERLAPLTAAQKGHFAKLCYESPERQRWLLGL
jgi:hypothetical protein